MRAVGFGAQKDGSLLFFDFKATVIDRRGEGQQSSEANRFVHLVAVGGALVANIVIGLAVGAVTGHWLVAFAIFVIATIVAIHGFLSGSRLPSAITVGVSLLLLALSGSS
jgi:hypothetical protein